MRIGELAARTGLSRDTIRFYERQGLIQSWESREPSNAYRDYPEDLVSRLAVIVEAREAGFPVADLGILLRALEHGADPDFDAGTFLDGKIAELRRSIERAGKFLDILETTRRALDEGPVEWRQDGVATEPTTAPRPRRDLS